VVVEYPATPASEPPIPTVSGHHCGGLGDRRGAAVEKPRAAALMRRTSLNGRKRAARRRRPHGFASAKSKPPVHDMSQKPHQSRRAGRMDAIRPGRHCSLAAHCHPDSPAAPAHHAAVRPSIRLHFLARGVYSSVEEALQPRCSGAEAATVYVSPSPRW
jgi:hypothetical protein